MENNKVDFNGEYGANYKNLARKISFGYDDYNLMILSYLSQSLNENASILDVGCGLADSLITFSEHKPNWKLTGVEPSQQMYNFAEQNIKTNNLKNRISLNYGSIESISKTEMFDAIILLLVLHFLPDDGSKLSLLKNINQHLYKGGSFILTSLYGESAGGIIQNLLPAWNNYMLYKGLTLETINSLRTLAQNSNYFVTKKRIEELLEEAGFTRIEFIFTAHMQGGWLAYK